MRVEPKAKILEELAAATTPRELYSIGKALIAISHCKMGNTLQESIDHYRFLWSGEKPIMEECMRQTWDEARAWK